VWFLRLSGDELELIWLANNGVVFAVPIDGKRPSRYNEVVKMGKPWLMSMDCQVMIKLSRWSSPGKQAGVVMG